MPCTDGGAPVTIETLFGLVKVGIAASAAPSQPSCAKPAIVGRMPSLMPCSTYAGSNPSTQITTTGRSGTRYRRPFSSIVSAISAPSASARRRLRKSPDVLPGTHAAAFLRPATRGLPSIVEWVFGSLYRLRHIEGSGEDNGRDYRCAAARSARDRVREGVTLR